MGRRFILFPPIRSIPLIKLFCPLFEELFKRNTYYSFFK